MEKAVRIAMAPMTQTVAILKRRKLDASGPAPTTETVQSEPEQAEPPQVKPAETKITKAKPKKRKAQPVKVRHSPRYCVFKEQ